MIDLRLGRWEDVLADVGEVDCVCTDPPYSERTHSGHDDGAAMANKKGGWVRASGSVDPFRGRRALSYSQWGAREINAFVESWAPRCRGWFVCMSDSDLCVAWREAFENSGLTGFQPVPVLMPGMTVRMAGDGPSSWAVYCNVARPRALHRWGTLPGGYHGSNGNGASRAGSHVGGKPLWLMRALVRDYSKPGDLVCDPCAGGGTTLLAAAIEGRRAIGAEVDPDTHAKATRRLAAGYTPDLFTEATS